MLKSTYALIGLPSLLAAAVLMTAGAAQAQHRDALVFEDGGQVQMGAIDVDCFSGVGLPGCDPNGTTERVYEAELLETGAAPVTGVADEPGFFAIPDGGQASLPFGNILPADATHSLDLILAPTGSLPAASILYWDGAGPVVWTGVPNLETFDVQGNGGSGGILNGANELLGIQLDSTAANGFFDTHPDFILSGNGGTQDPSVGFYALFGRTNIGGLLSSDPWAVVFDFGVENEVLHEAAIDSLTAALVPEPATWVLLGLGLLSLAQRRQRQRPV